MEIYRKLQLTNYENRRRISRDRRSYAGFWYYSFHTPESLYDNTAWV
jgi:hypothetical protein